MSDTWLSIIGGGLFAALVTIAANVLWDRKKQQMEEDWEFRRYRANQVHFAAVTFRDVFFQAKTEFEYLSNALGSMRLALETFTRQTMDALRQQQPRLGVQEFEAQVAATTQAARQFTDQQVLSRWQQYEQRIKDIQSRAEALVNSAQTLVPGQLYHRVRDLYERLGAPFEWTPENVTAKLRLFEAALPDFQEIQSDFSKHVEVELGRPSA